MGGVFSKTRIRAAVGLIAAYAIALQTLFAAFAPLPANATAADFSQIICFGSGSNSGPSGDSDAPAPAAGKFHCVLCLATAAAAILPEAGDLQPVRSSIGTQFAPVDIEFSVAPLAARSGPSRAPPLTL